MFSECVAFHIKEGVTLVGSARGADIRLYGREILSHHAIIMLLPQGKARPSASRHIGRQTGRQVGRRVGRKAGRQAGKHY